MPDKAPSAMNDDERRLWDECATRVYVEEIQHPNQSNGDNEISAEIAYDSATALILERRRRLS